MTIDDAIAVTEMTTDVATILSKILLKSCLLTYLCFPSFFINFLVSPCFHIQTQMFLVPVRASPSPPGGLRSTDGRLDAQKQGSVLHSKTLQGPSMFLPMAPIFGAFWGLTVTFQRPVYKDYDNQLKESLV